MADEKDYFEEQPEDEGTAEAGGAEAPGNFTRAERSA